MKGKLNYFRSKIIDNANSYLTMKDFNYGKNFTEGNSQNEYNKGNPNTSRSLSPNIQRQHLLYEKSKSKSKRIKQLGDMIYSRYTFKPNLSESKGFYPSNKNPILNQTFNNRLDIYQKQNEERQRELYSYYSPYNSNNAFHPKILANYKTEKRDVFYNNFIYAQKYENNRQIKQNELNNRYSEMSKTQLINKESVVIFNSMKEKIFKQIFLILDSDGDGIINTLNKDIKSLPDDVESVISPILLELKEENETLNEKEFTLACYHLYELLNYNERRILLNFGTQNRTLMQSKTNSNTNSKKTLRQLRPNQSYDINLIKEEINRSAQNSKSSFRK